MRFAALFLVLVMAMASMALAASKSDTRDVVVSAPQTKFRCIQGLTSGVTACKNIPFGQTTAGSNRFLPPKPLTTWNETLDCRTYGPGCISFHSGVDVAPQQSEDCLNLNVWTPSYAPGTSLPVMVWIYGGGFQEGFAQGPFELYDGQYYAEQHNVVVVNINYRMGALGFLVTDRIHGNAGLLDQRLALQWVQNNIKYFGGNPKRVTLFGESAGAMSTGIHTLSPGSQGLFQQAILQSNPVGLRYMTNARAGLFGMEFCRLVSCLRGNACDTACIQALPMDKVQKAAQASSSNATIYIEANYDHPLDGFLGYKPTIDGEIVLEQVVHLLDQGKAPAPIPMMVGVVSNEMVPFLAPEKTPAPLSMDLYTMAIPLMFGAEHGKLVTDWYTSKYSDALMAAIDTLSDVIFKCASQRWNVAFSKAGQKTFYYRYDHTLSATDLWTNFGFPELCRTKICHVAELPFTFHKTDVVTPLVNVTMTAGERRLSSQMAQYWTNFAHSGDPNVKPDGSRESITWPVFDANTRASMRFEVDEVAPENFKDLCGMWDTIGYDILVAGKANPITDFKQIFRLAEMLRSKGALKV